MFKANTYIHKLDQMIFISDAYAELTISIEEPQAQVEQDRYVWYYFRAFISTLQCLNLSPPHTVYIYFSLSPVHPDCTAMTKKYRARPWYGREVLNITVVS